MLPHPIHLKKVPVVVRPEYTILYERVPGVTFVHCEVRKGWTKEVKARLKEDWRTLCSLISPEPIYALHDPEDLKHEKFLKMFGFEFVHRYDEYDLTDLYKKDT